MVLTEDAVWVAEEGRITRIDPETNAATGGIDVPFQQYSFGIGFGSAWIPDYGSDEVHRYDLETGEAEATIPARGGPEFVTVTRDAVWVSMHSAGSVSRIDPTTDTVIATVQVGPRGPIGPFDIMEAARRIWVAVPNIQTVAGIDPATNEVVARVRLEGMACWVSYAADLVWAQSCHEEEPYVGAIDPATGEVLGTVDLGVHAGTVVEIDGDAWLPPLSPGSQGSMVRIDRETFEVADTVGLPSPGASFANSGFGSVWLALKTRVLRLPADAFEGVR